MIASANGGSSNLVSIAGINALGRSHLAYSMGMAGAAQRTRELSSEWAAKGVRVNAIVCAQLLNAELEKCIAADPTLGDTYLRGIPMGAWATPTTSRAWRFFSPPTPQRGSPAR